MNLMITLAVPKTEVLGMLYQAAKVYILLICSDNDSACDFCKISADAGVPETVHFKGNGTEVCSDTDESAFYV